MSDSDNGRDVSKLAREVIDELDSGRYGDKFVFNRRQVIALAGAGLSVGALTTLGVDDATAQEAVGQVGTASEPVDVEAANVNAGSVSTDSLLIDGILETTRIDEESGSTGTDEPINIEIPDDDQNYDIYSVKLDITHREASGDVQLTINNDTDDDYATIFNDGSGDSGNYFTPFVSGDNSLVVVSGVFTIDRTETRNTAIRAQFGPSGTQGMPARLGKLSFSGGYGKNDPVESIEISPASGGEISSYFYVIKGGNWK